MSAQPSLFLTLVLPRTSPAPTEWLAGIPAEASDQWLLAQWRDYEESRDPFRAADIAQFGGPVRSMAEVLLHLPSQELRSAVRQILLAALEAHARGDLTPVEDMVGGWLATAEVASAPALAAELDEAIRETGVTRSQCTAEPTPADGSITYTIPRSSYAGIARLSLRTWSEP